MYAPPSPVDATIAKALSSHGDADSHIPHRPTREHTEIEEELHDKANIDYDRVAIVSFPYWISLMLLKARLTVPLSRSQTLLWLLFTKMPLYTRLELPLHLPEL